MGDRQKKSDWSEKLEARFQRANLADPAPHWSERNQDIIQNWHAESALQWFRW